MGKNIFFVSSFFAFCLFLSCPHSAYALTEKDFQRDMAYYQKTAKNKNLSANDRLYILDRLRKKYSEAEFDLTNLYAEINRWTTEKIKEAKTSQPPKKVLKTKPEKKSAQLTSILVTESEKTTRIILEIPEIKEYKEIFQKDKKGLRPPVLVLYLYQTKEKLKPTSKNFVVKSGAVRQVQTKQISLQPPTVQVSISFREELPYTLEQKEKQLILNIEKTPLLAESTPTLSPTLFPSSEKTASKETRTTALSFSYRSPQYVIKQGDFLEIKVKPFDLSQRQMVKEDGTVELLPIGKIRIARLTILEAEKVLTKSLATYLQVEEVRISMEKPGVGQVLLVGQVKSPGSYILDRPLKCFELISKTGGFLPDADKKNVLIYTELEGKSTVSIFDIEAFLTTADPEKDFLLKPGDRIEIPRVKDSVFIFGAVKKPGFVPYKEELKMMQAIYLAGGLDEKRHTGKIRLVRTEGGTKTEREISLRGHLKKLPEGDLELKAGDFIQISQKSGLKIEPWMSTLLPWGIFLVSLGVILAILL